MREIDEMRRRIPSVDSLLRSASFGPLLRAYPRPLVLSALRRTLEDVRHGIGSGECSMVPGPAELARVTSRELEEMERPTLRRVINATGIPLHTNLGRAPLAESARRALEEISAGYSNLEYDLAAGRRGSRHDHCSELLRELTGAEAALVVNNNAAALVLALNELADGRDVIVSRGELVEIGGSFRVPEVVAKSGGRIVEVGATNRTHARDYENAVGPDTSVLLKVHRSNFTQAGFVADVGIEDIARIAHERGLLAVHDIGSGLLGDPGPGADLPWEPTVRGSLDAGADLVTFSGDKLLGGPQAGIIVGLAELIDRMRRNPLLRALRVGKLTLAALGATLRVWRDVERARAEIPALAMIAADPLMLGERAERLAAELRARVPAANIEVVDDVTEVGGGSFPGAELPARVVRVKAPDRSEGELERALRGVEPPVIVRVRDGALLLDPRTVHPGEEKALLEAVSRVMAGAPPSRSG
jgi:L-seryl-tRNA(Ser) seleniumtransferase